MFTIELLTRRGSDDVQVFERVELLRHLLYDAEHRAKTLLAEAKRQHPDNPPQGYRVLDASGTVVARFWR